VMRKGAGQHFHGGAESSHRRPVSASMNEKIQAFQPSPLERRGPPPAPAHSQEGSATRRASTLPGGRPSFAQDSGPASQPHGGRQTGEGFGRTGGEGFSEDVGHLHAQRLSPLDAALPIDAQGGSPSSPRSSFPGFPHQAASQGVREANGKVYTSTN